VPMMPERLATIAPLLVQIVVINDDVNMNNDGDKSDDDVRPFLQNLESSFVVTASDELSVL